MASGDSAPLIETTGCDAGHNDGKPKVVLYSGYLLKNELTPYEVAPVSHFNYVYPGSAGSPVNPPPPALPEAASPAQSESWDAFREVISRVLAGELGVDDFAELLGSLTSLPPDALFHIMDRRPLSAVEADVIAPVLGLAFAAGMSPLGDVYPTSRLKAVLEVFCAVEDNHDDYGGSASLAVLPLILSRVPTVDLLDDLAAWVRRVIGIRGQGGRHGVNVPGIKHLDPAGPGSFESSPGANDAMDMVSRAVVAPMYKAWVERRRADLFAHVSFVGAHALRASDTAAQPGIVAFVDLMLQLPVEVQMEVLKWTCLLVDEPASRKLLVCDTMQMWMEGWVLDERVREESTVLHYAGWSPRWDEIIPCASPRIQPFCPSPAFVRARIGSDTGRTPEHAIAQAEATLALDSQPPSWIADAAILLVARCADAVDPDITRPRIRLEAHAAIAAIAHYESEHTPWAAVLPRPAWSRVSCALGIAYQTRMALVAPPSDPFIWWRSALALVMPPLPAYSGRDLFAPPLADTLFTGPITAFPCTARPWHVLPAPAL